MITMFNSFFRMLAMFFSAGEKAASSLDHLAGWADDEASAFADKARVNRSAEMAQLVASIQATAPQSDTTTD